MLAPLTSSWHSSLSAAVAASVGLHAAVLLGSWDFLHERQASHTTRVLLSATLREPTPAPSVTMTQHTPGAAPTARAYRTPRREIQKSLPKDERGLLPSHDYLEGEQLDVQPTLVQEPGPAMLHPPGGISGWVSAPVELYVNEAGGLDVVRFDASPLPENLRQWMLAYLHSSKFAPGTKNGVSVKSKIAMNFGLPASAAGTGTTVR